MTDKEKQIEEMAEDIKLNRQITPNPKEHPDHQLARLLIKDGYRKERVGEWIDSHPNSPVYKFTCSLCKEIKLGKQTPYCPFCGARMKGE